ncbi:MAG: antitoxin VbhA family protein [Clostridiales bacterium]|nr:antitoxin VbhA family protein [Clostridiales bacterium]
MNQQLKNRRLAAVKVADAINAIEGVPVSDYVRSLSDRWVAGEITGTEMKTALLDYYRKLASGVPQGA